MTFLLAQLVKESACNAGYLGLIPGSERSSGEGIGHPLQYSCLENPHGQSSLVGYSPWGRKKSDTTEQLSTAHKIYENLLHLYQFSTKQYPSTLNVTKSLCQ